MVSKAADKSSNTNELPFPFSIVEARGAKQGGGGCNPPSSELWMRGGGEVEHLSTTPDFEKIFIRGGGGGVGPLN